MVPHPANPTGSRVLVIDDDRATRVLLRKVLTQSGFIVDLASGGQEGMQLALTQEYGAILLDWVMPQPDGSAVLREIASSAPALRAKIIIITGYPTQAVSTGAGAVLTKPLDVAEVIRLTSQAVQLTE